MNETQQLKERIAQLERRTRLLVDYAKFHRNESNEMLKTLYAMTMQERIACASGPN